MTAVHLSRVFVGYDGTLAVREIDARVAEGSWVGVIGPNGAGKTTLLRAVVGLVPHEGRIALGDTEVRAMSRRLLSRTVAYVPQRPVIPEDTLVSDYVLLGRTPHLSYLGTEGPTDRRIVSEVLERMELAGLADRPLGSLSGGEVQRAVVGRALAQRAPVLLLDEPTAALDVGHQQQVLELIDRLRREHRLTVLSAMHDLTLAGQFAERLILLSAGRSAAEGAAREILTEHLIREHYGASVRVLDDGRGGIVVVPSREEQAASRGASV